MVLLVKFAPVGGKDVYAIFLPPFMRRAWTHTQAVGQPDASLFV
jgi:hypothetical protein